MPKRSCPFSGENDSRLRKNHHSQADEEKRCSLTMATVYARTLQLLMGGAKQNGPNGPNNNHTNSCKSCVKILSENGNKNCSNCARTTCLDCLSCCDICSASICAMCSVQDFENPCVRRCLGCRDRA